MAPQRQPKAGWQLKAWQLKVTKSMVTKGYVPAQDHQRVEEVRARVRTPGAKNQP